MCECVFWVFLFGFFIKRILKFITDVILKKHIWNIIVHYLIIKFSHFQLSLLPSGSYLCSYSVLTFFLVFYSYIKVFYNFHFHLLFICVCYFFLNRSLSPLPRPLLFIVIYRKILDIRRIEAGLGGWCAKTRSYPTHLCATCFPKQSLRKSSRSVNINQAHSLTATQ